MSKATDLFESKMKGSSTFNGNMYKVTTAKRNSVTPPDGVMLYDEQEDKWYVGDGVTNGGRSIGSVSKVRKVPVDGVLATVSDSGSDASVFYWPTASGLRTGDLIVFAAGGGRLPSGAAGSITTAYITKQDDEGDGASNTGLTFKVATTRANALAGTTTTVLVSGATFQAQVSGVVVQGWEDVVLCEPVVTPLTIGLPEAKNNEGLRVLVKRGRGEGSGVVVTMVSGTGAFVASGNITMNDATGSFTLKGSTDDYAEFFSDGTNYWLGARQISS